MNNKKAFDLRKLMPYLTALLVFAVIITVYFYPALEGKILEASDITFFKGMSKEIVDYREKTGEEALWTNNMFGGMPAFQVSVKFTGNLMLIVHSILRLGFHLPIGMVIIYLLGFYFLLLTLRVNPWLSIAGAIAFAFSSYFFIIFEPGHTSKAYAIGFMAPVLAGIIMTYRGRYILGSILTAFFLALEITSGHPQITYYLMIMVVVFGILELVNHYREKQLPKFFKATGLLVLAAFIAVLTNAGSLLTTYEYSKFSLRGKTELSSDQANRTSGLDKDYATAWSYGVDETMTLLIPNFKGGSTQGQLTKNSDTYQVLKNNRVPNADKIIGSIPLYWGTQPSTSGPVYVGALVFFLFIFSLFYLKGPIKWWGIIITVVSIMLAWGKNFMPLTDFFLEYFPLYNKFRSVTMILVMAELTMPLMAFLALDRFLSGDHGTRAMKYLKNSVYIVGGILLLFILFGGTLYSFTGPRDAEMGIPEWLQDALRGDRLSMFRTDAIRSLVFVLLTFGLLYAFAKKKLKLNYILILLPVLVLVDMWPVNKRYLNNEDFVRKSQVDRYYQPTKADLAILQDKSLSYRVFNFGESFDGSARTSYFHKNIGGYHGAKMRRYQEVVDHCLVGERSKLANELQDPEMNLKEAFSSSPVFNMLNTKYFIVSATTNPVKNPDALGNAWFVNDYRLVDNADEEIDALTGFDPAILAIIDKKFAGELKGFNPSETVTGGEIKLTSYDPKHMVYEYSAPSEKLAVFSEIYYPKGWNAYVDGKKMPHFRANYILRAMVLPAGEHRLEFRFEPKAYYAGQNISLASSILLLFVLLGYGVKEVIKRRKAA